jgi:hypothetical protein
MLKFSINNITVGQLVNYSKGRNPEQLFNLFFGINDYHLTTKDSNILVREKQICKGRRILSLKNTHSRKIA